MIAVGGQQVAIDAGVGDLVVSLQGSVSFLEKSAPRVVVERVCLVSLSFAWWGPISISIEIGACESH